MSVETRKSAVALSSREETETTVSFWRVPTGGVFPGSTSFWWAECGEGSRRLQRPYVRAIPLNVADGGDLQTSRSDRGGMGRWNGGSFTRDSGVVQGRKGYVEGATNCPIKSGSGLTGHGY